MAFPDYQSLFLLLLEIAGSGGEVSLSEVKEELDSRFGLSEEDRKTLLPSGRQFLFDNRVGWARTYLTRAGLIEYRQVAGSGYAALSPADARRVWRRRYIEERRGLSPADARRAYCEGEAAWAIAGGVI